VKSQDEKGSLTRRKDGQASTHSSRYRDVKLLTLSGNDHGHVAEALANNSAPDMRRPSRVSAVYQAC
jgi:hypothetical protein